VLTHPALDWLNNYGMRWLMPFDGRWFYGDALFIVDPWVWLVLGGVVFLGASRSATALSLWAVFWLTGTWLLFNVPFVPALARALWVAGVVALVVIRSLRPGLSRPPASERLARVAIGCVAAYMCATLAASAVARRDVQDSLAAAGVGPITSVMVGPVAANPFAGAVVVVTPEAYQFGEWRWLAEPRLKLTERVERRAADPVAAAASQVPDARDYLTWSRYPYFEIDADDDGYLVQIRDARYREVGQLDGPRVRLDRDLNRVTIAE
jgi:inner membrane protein